jgi:hypothetical protein
MPVHDWSRVDANLYHHFHQRWTIAICDVLNAGLLPPGYSALVEQHAGGLIPDVLTVEARGKLNHPPEPQVGTLTVTPPQTRFVRQTKAALAARANRVSIHHPLGEVVCILEIVSPGNKGSRAALRAFVEKTIDFLQRGIHLLVIDLLPPTPRDPQGMHQAIWDEIDGEPLELPPDKPLTLSAYVAGDLFAGIETRAYVEVVGVGDKLPNMPAYLDRSGYVSVPLEETYQATWATCPAAFRELVERGN